MANVQDRGPPSVAAVAVATALVSVTFTYFFCQARSVGVFGRSLPHTDITTSPDDAHNNDGDSDDSLSDDEAPGLGELKAFPGNTEECKLVLVVRSDLGMGKGKIAAQCSHATLACYKSFLRINPAHPVLKQWERRGQAKVALKVDSEDDMMMLQAQAVSLGLCAQVIHDAGRTQIASGSATVLGIGPAPKSEIDQVTGHLKLL